MVSLSTIWAGLHFTLTNEATLMSLPVFYIQICILKSDEAHSKYFWTWKSSTLKVNFSPYALQMGEVWNELQPKLGCLFGGKNGLNSHFWSRRGRGGSRGALPLTRIPNWKITRSVSSSENIECKVFYYKIYIPLVRGVFHVNGCLTFFSMQ